MALVIIILLLPTTVENAYNELEARLEPPQIIYQADLGDYEIRATWIGENKFEWVKIYKKPMPGENIKRSSKIPFKGRHYGKNIEHIRQTETEG